MIKAGDYTLSAQLMMAQSVAEDAPLNGTEVASAVEISFSMSETRLSMKVTVANDAHLFGVGSDMNLNIKILPASLPNGYKLVAAQEQKRESDLDYSFYGMYYEPAKTGSGYTLHTSAPASPGNYRIRFYIETNNGTKVLETVYYFLVQ